MSEVLFIGIGNRYRRDDGAGLAAASRLKAMRLENLEIQEEPGEGTALMQSWENHDFVILCDAISSGGTPGAVKQFDPREQKIPAQSFRHSTHAFSLPEALELARSLNRLPRRIMIYGIEGENFEPGEGLSSGVEQGVTEVVSLVHQEVAKARV